MYRTNLCRQNTDGLRAHTSLAAPTRWTSVPVTAHERQDATQRASSSFLQDAKRARARRRLRDAVKAVISNRFTERFSLDEPGVPASAVNLCGEAYQLDVFQRQQSVTSIKRKLAQLQPIPFEIMVLYLKEDVRSEDEDLQLKNSETVEEIMQYLPPQTSSLELLVMAIDQCDILIQVRDGLTHDGELNVEGWDTLEEHRDPSRCQGVYINEFGEITKLRICNLGLTGRFSFRKSRTQLS